MHDVKQSEAECIKNNYFEFIISPASLLYHGWKEAHANIQQSFC